MEKARSMKKVCCYLLLALIPCTTSSCFRVKRSNGGGQVENVKPRRADAKDVAVREGLRVEVVSTGLTFPTGITFDEDGVPYVVEAGYAYGEVWEEPRLLRIEPDGSTTVVASGGRKGPWNGVYYDNGFF
jgi:glucose/arabinose dehydrogenase